jgi:hypothetical protein
MFILAMKVSSNSFARKKCPYRLAIDKKGGTVEHWSSWDWLTYISIWIAAIFIAIREAVRTTLSPTNIFRRAIRARYLAYLPIVLMTVGGLILLLAQLDISGQKAQLESLPDHYLHLRNI